ncbi:hypothetical protein B6S12_09540 [Helicobacter valdiviensis]|uniref:RloB domain-containing protein n=2 Tax=Helicobacter valdiviensis TaxID=1458358 RepID=A0A2W6MTU4_9HELI|nr:RloB domain-containing protein [Helicobacter valdiviensis]PZT47339.1 hypothetical protein B6S12_09540 [Helicobacter valdiviensis]
MNRRENKKIKPNIQIWCEGKTEEEYFKSLLREIRYENIHISIKNLKNKNSYKNIFIDIKREPYPDKLIIVIDLDRAKNDNNELKYLKNLISEIKKSKGNIKIFLTLDNFEDWLRFHFKDNSKNSKESFYKKLGYSDAKSFKASTKDLYYQILDKGGNIKNAENYFQNIECFYNNEYIINENSLHFVQSNLYLFRAFIEKINQ